MWCKVEGLEIKKKEENSEQNNENNNETNSIIIENSKGPSVSQDTNNNSSSKAPSTPVETTPTQTILYEYVKEVERYSVWYTGKVTGNNIENSTKTVSYSKFCKIGNSSNCVTDKTENASKYTGYKKTKTWNEIIDIYRYKITVEEYVYTNATSLEGYTKTGNTKIAD